MLFGLLLGGCVTLLVGYVIYALLSSDNSDENTDIDAFFIESNGDHEKAEKSSEDLYHRKYDKEGRQILIAYGTEYGFSEEIGKKLFDRLEAEKVDKNEDFPLQPRLVNVKHYEFIDFDQEQLMFVIISTAGDGIPPTEARAFCTWLSDESRQNFPHLQYSVLALGDSNYSHFCRTGKTLDKTLQDVAARSLVPCQHVDMEDWEVINGWIDEVIRVIDTVRISPTLDYLDITAGEDTSSEPSRKRPFMARLLVKKQLTTCGQQEDKETIHCEFDLTDSNITWMSGDALGVYPENNPTEVKTLLTAMKCDGSEQVDTPKSAFQPIPDGQIDLHTALMKYFDLKVVRLEFLQFLQNKSLGLPCQAELNDLLLGGLSKKNTFLHEYLYEREIADILEDFSSLVSYLSPAEILSQMKGLQPRYYSVASSSLQSEVKCSVTAAVVRYNTLGRPRTGVTTTYLQDRLQLGQYCPVFISCNPEFRLPVDISLPIIMVGPGTGIAPFMAFINERALTGSSGINLLYFGCRHREGDFLYKDVLDSWVAEGKLELQAAFSRDQPQKVYVQHLIQKDRDRIWQLVHEQHGHLYICGDARHMAHDVHKELVIIIQTRGHLTEEEAENYLLNLEAKKKKVPTATLR